MIQYLVPFDGIGMMIGMPLKLEKKEIADDMTRIP